MGTAAKKEEEEEEEEKEEEKEMEEEEEEEEEKEVFTMACPTSLSGKEREIQGGSKRFDSFFKELKHLPNATCNYF